MKLLIIRHGDPDYEHDTLTEKGWREARYLADRLVDMDIQYFYVSPLGRARDTAAPTLERLGKQGVECPWLREFTVAIRRPDRPERDSICWDWLPQDWTGDGRLYSVDRWQENEVMAAGGVKREYDRVTDSLDRLLASHGYVREGRHYRVERANHDTLAFFCHFGSGCVLLSHLLGAPPMVLWQGRRSGGRASPPSGPAPTGTGPICMSRGSPPPFPPGFASAMPMRTGMTDTFS